MTLDVQWLIIRCGSSALPHTGVCLHPKKLPMAKNKSCEDMRRWSCADERASAERKHPKQQGLGARAWVVCAAATLVQFVVLGIHNSFGVLYLTLDREFHWKKALTGECGALVRYCYVIQLPILITTLGLILKTTCAGTKKQALDNSRASTSLVISHEMFRTCCMITLDRSLIKLSQTIAQCSAQSCLYSKLI